MTNEQYILSHYITENHSNTVYVVGRATKWVEKKIWWMTPESHELKSCLPSEWQGIEGAVKLTSKKFDMEHAARCEAQTAIRQFREGSYNGRFND